MRPKSVWMLSLVPVLVGLVAGCQEPEVEPVAQAPVQEPPPPPFPEDQVPAPEPQPLPAAPPVDTVAGQSKTPQPKESYAPIPPDQSARTYVVRKGDTLYKISQKFYGNKKNWRRIYKANRKTLTDGPDKIQPGMKLVIP